MNRVRVRDALLLLSAAASLLFGGGLGCEPELDGVDFRPTSLLTDPNDKDSPRDWYQAFGGKKAPGNGWAVLPYPVKPTFAVRARMGVFLSDALAASEDAEGCIGFRNNGNLSEEYRLCVSYQLAPAKTLVFSNLDGLTADCLAATKVELELEDDSADVTARYRCPGDVSYTDLTSAATQWNAGEKWFTLAGAYNLRKGAQIGFDAFDIDTTGPLNGSTEAQIAFAGFDGFRFGLRAFYELEALDLAGAQTFGGTAFGALQSSYQQTVNGGYFPGTNAGKLVTKSFMSYGKLYDGLFEGKEAKYSKAFPKFADTEACALDEMWPFF